MADFGYVHWPIIQVRATAPLGGEQLLPGRVEDHTCYQLPCVLERERYVVCRKTMGEVRGSIDGVHVPAVLGRGFVTAAFFRDNRMSRKVRAQPLDDKLFGRPVRLCDQIEFALKLKANGASG